eukprot:sb/3476694/
MESSENYLTVAYSEETQWFKCVLGEFRNSRTQIRVAVIANLHLKDDNYLPPPLLDDMMYQQNVTAAQSHMWWCISDNAIVKPSAGHLLYLRGDHIQHHTEVRTAVCGASYFSSH